MDLPTCVSKKLAVAPNIRPDAVSQFVQGRTSKSRADTTDGFSHDRVWRPLDLANRRACFQAEGKSNQSQASEQNGAGSEPPLSSNTCKVRRALNDIGFQHRPTVVA